MHNLRDHNGELKDYLVHLSLNQLHDPSANICAGVRWIFRKKVTASSRLNREENWEEAVIFYKSYWNDVSTGHLPSGLKKLRDYYNRLKGK